MRRGEERRGEERNEEKCAVGVWRFETSLEPQDSYRTLGHVCGNW